MGRSRCLDGEPSVAGGSLGLKCQRGRSPPVGARACAYPQLRFLIHVMGLVTGSIRRLSHNGTQCMGGFSPSPGAGSQEEGGARGGPTQGAHGAIGARLRGRLTCCCIRCRGRAVRWGKVGDDGTSSWLLCRRRHSKLKEDL